MSRSSGRPPAGARTLAGSADLQERELIKMARLTAAVAQALRRRGVDPSQAGLTAQAGVSAFTTAFARWVEGHPSASFPSLVAEALDDLRRAVGAAWNLDRPTQR